MIYKFDKVLFNSLKGRLGGYIYYVWKKNTYKDHPETLKQRPIRKAFSKVDVAFRSCTPAQRHAWRLSATRHKKYTNYSYFMSINIKRVLEGLPITKEAP
jgi:hypothetical protein